VNLILFDTQSNRYDLDRNDDRHRHIHRILKAAIGDTLRVGVANGAEGTATVVQTGKDGTTLDAQWERPGRSPLPVEVILGHPRPPVLQRLFRDLASMRIRRLTVFAGDLGERSYYASSVWDGMETRLREGASQGRHTALPEVVRVSRLEEALDQVGDGKSYFGAVDRAGAITFRDMLSEIAAYRSDDLSVILCIGPERGFSDRETELLAHRSVRPVSLGASVLRTETAVTGIVLGAASVLCRSEERQL
jgi:RsmE family RNA methyltransferase